MIRYATVIRLLLVPLLLFTTRCSTEKTPQDTPPESPEKIVYRVSLKEAITPASMESLSNAIRTAEKNRAAALLVVLDTPGGLASSMDEMIRQILSSRVPVITYVGPPGATCGSAGVYIMYASHLTAMAPATNIGSATPVMMGGGGGDEEKTDPSDDSIPEEAGVNDAVNLKRKQIHHAVAQIRALAEFHKRDATFAEQSITRAENITSTEALKRGVIDLMAETETELLQKADGRTVRMSGRHETLDLKEARIVTLEKDTRSELLTVLANPNLAYILMMLGVVGILAEIQYPGSIFPGVLGAISLLLGLYAMQSLPINYAGLGLIVLGIVLIVMEFQIVSYGLLSVAGLGSLLMGSLMLVPSDDELYHISRILIFLTTLVTGSFVGFLAYKSVQTLRRKPNSGDEVLMAETGSTTTEVTPSSGKVYVNSEFWSAKTEGETIPANTSVRILRREGMTLVVSSDEPST